MEKTAAQKKAQRAYIAKQARVELRMTPEQRDRLKAVADKAGVSVNVYALDAIMEKLNGDV